jgi:hypothetical protein
VGLKAPEYIMRVKLPSSASFHSGPSGDTEYEEAYKKAIFDKKPEGFEVSWKTQATWPVDKDGMTWVKLYCTGKKEAVKYWIDKVELLTKKLEQIQSLVKQVGTLTK